MPANARLQTETYTRQLQPLKYHAEQYAFLQARRTWLCAKGHPFEREAGADVCPMAPCTGCDKWYHFEAEQCPFCATPAVSGRRPCLNLPVMHAYHRLLILANRRGGKTRMGALGVIEEAAIPNTLIWIVGPTYGHLHDYMWPAILSQIPRTWLLNPDHPIHETHQEVALVNGSLIQGRSAQDPEKLQGQGPQASWWDEAALSLLAAWQYFAPSLAESRGPAWFTTTPAGYDWTYEEIELDAREGKLGYWFIEYGVDTSPVPEIRAEAAEAKLKLPPDLYAEKWQAKRIQFTGAIYGQLGDLILESDGQVESFLPEWKNDQALDKERTGFLGIDPGAGGAHPYAAACAVGTEKGWVFYGEYLERARRSNVEHRAAIGHMARGLTLRAGIDRRRAQDQAELSHYGLFCTQVGGEVWGEVQYIRSLMYQKKLWFIRSKVPQLIKEWEGYRVADAEKPDGSVKNQPVIYKKRDDLVDAARYGIDIAGALPEPPLKVEGRDPMTVPEEVRLSWIREQKKDGKIRDPNAGLESLPDYPLVDFFHY